MTILESVFLFMVGLSMMFLFFIVCSVIYWILEKIGFLHWLRGWMWYFGFIEKCPDVEK